MNLVKCAFCKLDMEPRPDGSCPSCRQADGQSSHRQATEAAQGKPVQGGDPRIDAFKERSRERFKDRDLYLMAGAVAIALWVFFVACRVNEIPAGILSYWWPRTTGELYDVAGKTERYNKTIKKSGGGQETRQCSYTTWKVRYRYVVPKETAPDGGLAAEKAGGKPYVSTRLGFGDQVVWQGGSRGGEVWVYYNPSDPGTAVLVRGFHPSDNAIGVMLISGGFLLLCLIVAVLKLEDLVRKLRSRAPKLELGGASLAPYAQAAPSPPGQ